MGPNTLFVFAHLGMFDLCDSEKHCALQRVCMLTLLNGKYIANGRDLAGRGQDEM